MKNILMIVLCGISYCNLHSQTDSSAKSFFPAAVGDSWHYQYSQASGYTTTLTHDSIANGARFLFFDSSNVPSYKIDSTMSVITNPLQNVSAAIEYKLAAKKNETWVWRLRDTNFVGVRIVARIDDIFWDYVLGSLTQVRRIGYYYQPSTDTTSFTAWQRDNYIAAAFGFYKQITDATQTPAVELYGCIIDGQTYGTMTSVRDDDKGFTPTLYKLYPAYPNPFNPSTMLSYELAENTMVILKVYDILGKEIVTLVNGSQQRGKYHIYFSPIHFSSGTYFIRLTAGKFTQTIKAIYSK